MASRARAVLQHVRPGVESDCFSIGGPRPVACSTAQAESVVKDRGLAELGRKELGLAEHEMPGSGVQPRLFC